jgi:uncharacterized protein YcbX
MTDSVEITALHVYPVKACKGMNLARAAITGFGLEHDRSWMVVRDDGRFVTQRDNARLSAVAVGIDGDGVLLSAAGQDDFHLSFDQPGGTPIRSRVWKDDVETVDLGEAASAWLTKATGSDRQLRLVRMAPGFRRGQSMAEQLGAGTEVRFADAAPVLVTSESSLERLNEALEAKGEAPVPMNRFRANVVVRGLEPFAENHIEGLAGEGVRFRFRMPCERCVVTTIDQESSERHPRREPFVTVRDLNPMPDNPRSPVFGHYATVEAPVGADIRVGQAFDVVCR